MEHNKTESSVNVSSTENRSRFFLSSPSAAVEIFQPGFSPSLLLGSSHCPFTTPGLTFPSLCVIFIDVTERSSNPCHSRVEAVGKRSWFIFHTDIPKGYMQLLEADSGSRVYPVTAIWIYYRSRICRRSK